MTTKKSLTGAGVAPAMLPDVRSGLMAAAVVLLVACPAFAAEWNQWGGSPSRNNVPEARNLPTEWAPG